MRARLGYLREPDQTDISCSSCVRSFHFLARTQPDAERDAKGITCYYQGEYEDGEGEGEERWEQEEPEVPKQKVEEPDQAQARIQQLELQVGESIAYLIAGSQGSTRWDCVY